MINYITPNDFYISQQNELCVKIQGFSFIFFTLDTCEHCKDVIPSFVRLSDVLKGCVYGLMDVGQDGRKIVTMSASTKNKLEVVPYVMLYVNGVPRYQYIPDEHNPESNFEKMRTFLLDATAMINGTNTPQPQKQSISQHSTGVSGSRKRVCYLSYDKAYSK